MLDYIAVNKYTYHGKNYTTYISGTTGKVIGKTPKSKWSFVRKFLKVAGAAALIYLLYWLITKQP